MFWEEKFPSVNVTSCGGRMLLNTGKSITVSSTSPTCHIFPVLSIKHLINQDGEPSTPHELAIVKKTSVSNMHILFSLYVLQKANAHVDTNALNMCHQ